MRVLRAFSPLICFVLLLLATVASAQGVGNRISATKAFDAGCSSAELGGVSIPSVGSEPSPARLDPEWAVIISDSNKTILNQPPQLVEGSVTLAPDAVSSNNYQANAEVAEEDIAWTHYTHDYTFKLTPDSPTYDYVLTYHKNSDGSIGLQPDMEVEWDNGSLMDEHEGFQRIWGDVPEFVWPSYGDRIWILGQWIFDCGHPGSGQEANVRYETEIHPPRALVTYRLFHTALDSFPRQRTSEPSYPDPESYLPVTGGPQPAVTTQPTQVPLTEADIFVSGNGGGARDLCSLVAASPSYTDVNIVIQGNGYTTCGSGHTNPVSPVNDRNYVFDVYPPVTDYTMPDLGGNYTMSNGYKVYPWTVYPPTADASLQYRIVDHSSELPAHTCGGNDTSNCVTVTPTICLIDNTTPPPNQSETSCPPVPARPTRLRVILPFKGTSANYFAQSILLGWDDVLSPTDDLRVRTFKVRLHKFTINDNGAVGSFKDGDWRVFLNVNGQWRYMDPFFDTNAFSNQGIKAFDGGDNVCQGDALTENGNDDCFQFDNTPFIVNIANEEPIHVGLGGFVSRDVENAGASAAMCRNFPGGCDPLITANGILDLATLNDDRIARYEFDLKSTNEYNPPNVFTTTKFACAVFVVGDCNIQYTADFTVSEVSIGDPPTSGDPTLGTPKYTTGGTFITSATPVTLSLTNGSAATNFQFRFHKQGAALPSFSSPLPFPVHWTSASVSGSSVDVYLNGAGGAAGDGPYDLQYSAEADFHLLEPRHTDTLILDNTPPVTTFVQPAANAQYGHSDTLLFNYSEGDGTGSGVDAASIVPKMDNQTASQLCNSLTCLNSGQPIYLESMSLGVHAFSVSAADNLGNAGTNAVTFTITVTFASLLKDVTNLQAQGCLDNIGMSLTAKISAALNLYGNGQLQTAINILSATIAEVQAQAGKHISSTCQDPLGRAFDSVQFLLGDIRYLITSVAGQLKPDPIFGSVVDSGNVAIGGAVVNLMNGKTLVATTTTDVAGLYFFADVRGLSANSNYAVNVTVPKGYKNVNAGIADLHLEGCGDHVVEIYAQLIRNKESHSC